jgi:hypothetical protein
MLLSRAKQSRNQTIIGSKLSYLFSYDRPQSAQVEDQKEVWEEAIRIGHLIGKRLQTNNKCIKDSRRKK